MSKPQIIERFELAAVAAAIEPAGRSRARTMPSSNYRNCPTCLELAHGCAVQYAAFVAMLAFSELERRDRFSTYR